MNINSFFNSLETQYNNQLPFVVYSRPINSIINCWLQNDDTLYITSNFSESGFVFAPFNLNDKSVLFPQKQSNFFKIETEAGLKIDIKEHRKCNAIETETEKQKHINLVLKGIEAIKSGDLDKVVLSRIEEQQLNNVNPISLFKRLFNTYKNAMVYCWYHPKIGLWLGATPELLFKVEGKQLTTISLAGTQPYAKNEDVSWTHKEYEEQQIVTDYITKQIQPFVKQIKISNLETVKAGNLLHLKSRITSLINNSTNLKSIIEALHPTPAICGFPKQKSKNFILQNENYNRKYYTGFLGELNLKQSKTRNTNRQNVENNAYIVVKTQSNFYVNLRCMQLINHKALIYVGGGVTKNSVAENEWIETVNKTKTIGDILD